MGSRKGLRATPLGHSPTSDLELAPWRVTWSPDGTYLLYVAWTYPNGTDEQIVVVAVPTDLDGPAVVLTEMDAMVAYDGYDGYDDTMRGQPGDPVPQLPPSVLLSRRMVGGCTFMRAESFLGPIRTASPAVR